MAHLRVLLEEKPEPLSKRAHEREPFRLRVVSSKLPGYQGVATNLSELGAEIQCQGALPLGAKLALRLEPDRGNAFSLDVEAIVRRCEGSRKSYLLGVEFVGLSASAQRHLAEVLGQLRNRVAGVLPNEGPVR